MADPQKKLIILGGGITGLAAAYLAARMGRQVTVLEGSPQLGGLLQTFPVGGNRLEYFYHHHFTHDVDLVIGLVKAFIFGGIIALIGCYKGMTCGLGAQGVGRATTEAVVYASISILITNFFLTLVMGKLVGQL